VSRYAWEPEAIEEVHARGLEPHEVMQALLHRPRIRKWLSDEVLGIWSRSRTGRHLLVMVAEAGAADDFEYWILGAREMLPGERKWFDDLMGGRDEPS
jgi:hypothetical protein